PNHVVADRGSHIYAHIALYAVEPALGIAVHAYTDSRGIGADVATSTSTGVARAVAVVSGTNGGSRAIAAKSLTGCEQRIGGGTIHLGARALIDARAVPRETVTLERAKNTIGGSRHFPRRVDVLDADEPLSAGLPRMHEARHRRGERAYV